MNNWPEKEGRQKDKLGIKWKIAEIKTNKLKRLEKTCQCYFHDSRLIIWCPADVRLSAQLTLPCCPDRCPLSVRPSNPMILWLGSQWYTVVWKLTVKIPCICHPLLQSIRATHDEKSKRRKFFLFVSISRKGWNFVNKVERSVLSTNDIFLLSYW